MKEQKKHGRQRKVQAACLALLLSFALPAAPAFAGECESNGAAWSAAQGIARSQDILLDAHYLPPSGKLPAYYKTRLHQTEVTIKNAIDVMEAKTLAKMRGVWLSWFDALRGSTAELASGNLNAARQIGSMMDAANTSERQRRHQRRELAAKKTYNVSDQTCRFDTAASYLAETNAVGGAVSTVISMEFNALGNTNKNTVANQGAASLQKSRWQAYTEKFCDGTSNAGAAGCLPGNPLAGAHVLPGRTFFAKDTIDMSDADRRDAVYQLVFNITGFAVPEPMDQGVLKSSDGKKQRIQDRGYLAQMDAVGALVYSIIGDRASGPAAPEVQELRQSLGVLDASSNPSAKEIRQSVVEQLWNPNYYTGLIDDKAAVAQKETYLRAYNLLLLHKIIEKTEKISNVYAIETANLIDKHMGATRESAVKFSPLK